MSITETGSRVVEVKGFGYILVSLTLSSGRELLTFIIRSCNAMGEVWGVGDTRHALLFKSREYTIDGNVVIQENTAPRFYFKDKIPDTLKAPVHTTALGAVSDIIKNSKALWVPTHENKIESTLDYIAEVEETLAKLKQQYHNIAKHVAKGVDIERIPLSKLGTITDDMFTVGRFKQSGDDSLYATMTALPYGTAFFVGDFLIGYKTLDKYNHDFRATYVGYSALREFLSNYRMRFSEMYYAT